MATLRPRPAATSRSRSQSRARKTGARPASQKAAEKSRDDGRPGVLARAAGLVTDLATNPRHTSWLIPALVLVDALVCFFVITKVSYTEIDWATYMEQVRMIVKDGYRTYGDVKGPAGPLVYPAGHVWLYSALFYLTDEGRNVRLAQWLFGGLYLAGLSLTMAVYKQAGAPPWLFPVLTLSKRLHSVFMLRLFNDSFVSVFTMAAVLAYQKRYNLTGSLLAALALSTKMSVLLILPALCGIFLATLSWSKTVTQLLLIGYTQTALAYPFLTVDPAPYFANAYNLARQFDYRWTVNWRLVPQHVFQSGLFGYGLLAAHAAAALAFFFTRWLPDFPNSSTWKAAREGRDTRLQVEQLYNAPEQQSERMRARLRPRSTPRALLLAFVQNQDALFDLYAAGLRARSLAVFVPTSLFSATALGMLFARSLHYQFYAWIFWMTPFLVWRGAVAAGGLTVLDNGAAVAREKAWPLSAAAVLAVVAAQEWGWNVFPSTPLSSAVVVLALAAQTAAGWYGAKADFMNGESVRIRVETGAAFGPEPVDTNTVKTKPLQTVLQPSYTNRLSTDTSKKRS